nr:EOG090X03H5 [Leptodora kindtii]
MKVIKKLKGRIGLGSNNADSACQPVLQFHNTRGEHVRISADRSTARRFDSFCKGIAFSQRPVKPNEKVYLRVVESSTSWNGVLRIGFTSCNPASYQGSLPKYACPDLTSRSGFWGKALPERYVELGVLFSFYFTAGGDVMLNVDGHDKGVFLSGVDSRTPLWVMVDIYGNTTAVQFVDPRASLNNNQSARQSPTRRSTSSIPAAVDNRPSSSGGAAAVAAAAAAGRPRSEADLLVSMNALNLNRGGGANQIPTLPLPPIPAAASSSASAAFIDPPAIPLRFQRGVVHPASLTLHRGAHGANVRLSPDGRTAVRAEAEFCNGYVFTSRPLNCGEPEYWVISKDVARGPNLGDELEFHLSHSGQVTMSRNGAARTLLMHVDTSLPLWAVFDVYGSTRALRLAGTVTPATPRLQRNPLPAAAPAPVVASAAAVQAPIYSAPAAASSSTVTGASAYGVLSSGAASYVETLNNLTLAAAEANSGAAGECTVCYERAVDCVLYSCGHMCLCYDCALQLYRGQRSAGGQGLCPICRAPIRDVIRAYRS